MLLRRRSAPILLGVGPFFSVRSWSRAVGVLLICARVWLVAIRRLAILRVIGRYRRQSYVAACRGHALMVCSDAVIFFAWWGRVLRFGLVSQRWITTTVVMV